MASLGVKQEVLSWTYSQCARPRIILAEHPTSPWHGWTAVNRDVLKRARPNPSSSAEEFFYIHELRGLTYDPKLHALSKRHAKTPPVVFRSIEVFRSNKAPFLPMPGEAD